MFFPIPPVTGSGDANFSNVRLLLRMNGENNGTTFTDESNDARTITRAGNVLPVTDASVKKYGTASAQFPTNSSGTPAHLRVTTPAIGTGQFTLEAWFYLTSSGSVYIIDTRNNSGYSSQSSTDPYFVLLYSSVAGNVLRLTYYVSNVATALDGVTTLSTNTWYHVALTRDSSNVVRLFLNGNLENSATISHNWTGIYWSIGAISMTTNATLRYLDDLRLTTGVCRYSASFTSPTAELPNSATGESVYSPQSIITPSQIAHPQHHLVRLGL